jgi:hypothetical protein
MTRNSLTHDSANHCPACISRGQCVCVCVSVCVHLGAAGGRFVSESWLIKGFQGCFMGGSQQSADVTRRPWPISTTTE